MKKIQLSLIAILLILTGFMIRDRIARESGRKVVFYQSAPGGQTGSAVIPAALNLPAGDLPSLASFNEAFVNIAENVNPSVVTITAERVIKTRYSRSPAVPGFEDDWFWRFFGPPDMERRGLSLGSGVIVDQHGYILTNNHVIENSEKIRVKLIDDREYKGKIIGSDARTDLAVIKIEADDLKPALLGDSDALRIGEWVLAIGSPLSEELAHSVTAGIVSAKGRSNVLSDNSKYQHFIQTDAAINPGNSGGALVNIRGELVGINTAIATNDGRAGNIGIGFAIPINMAKKIMSDLIEKGRVIRAWLGVTIQPVDDRFAKAMKLDTRQGALVGSVVKDSPAQKAGIETGDVIIEIDGAKITDPAQLSNLIASSDVGKSVQVKIIRNGKEQKIKVKLGEMPESVDQLATAEPESQTKLGLKVEPLTEQLAQRYGISDDAEGVVVTEVDRQSEAARAIRPGDLIQRVGDKTIKNIRDFNEAVSKLAGEYALLLINRRGQTFFVTIDLRS